MVANAVILIGISAWILHPVDRESGGTAGGGPVTGATPSTTPTGTATVPTKAELLSAKQKRFGLSAPEVPWSARELNRIAQVAGARPTLLQFFVNWTEDFRAESVAASYRQGAIPLISWEPWAGLRNGEDQKEYALATIISGKHDAYLTKFAGGIRDHGWPVAIRLAHEMNGHWYPWSEQRSGNKKGEYVKAWRHIHTLFTKAGATNVIWVWSPNIIRPVKSISLKALYPGDAYVDWIGLVGYAVEESTAAAVFKPSLDKLRKFTDKPLLITETGAQPSTRKVGWITDFFHWLDSRPDIVGFVWFEYGKNTGGNQDWRFSANPETSAAFRTGLTTVALAPPPS